MQIALEEISSTRKRISGASTTQILFFLAIVMQEHAAMVLSTPPLKPSVLKASKDHFVSSVTLTMTTLKADFSTAPSAQMSISVSS